MNTSYSHFQTDRSNFYFGQPVHFGGQIYNYVGGGTSDPYWRAGNDGSGSGLDADLLDGLNSTQFIRSDTQATTSAPLTIGVDWGQGTYNSAFVIQGTYPSWETRGTSAQPYGWLHHQDGSGNYTLYSIAGYTGSNWTQRFTFNHGDGTFRNGGPTGNVYYHQGNDGSGSGLDADLLDGLHASSFVRSDAVTIMSSTGIGRNDHHRGHLVGSYNNVGANSAKTNPIYSIGSAYIPSATSLSGFYGLGFSHPNLWGSGKTAGWGIYTTDNGTVTFTAGYSGGTSGIGVWSQGMFVSSGQGTLWGSSNDGSGSGLDADTLDGQHATAFALSTFNVASGSATADPNTKTDTHFLTNHSNAPYGGVFSHIQNHWWSSVGGNVAQHATTYNGSTARFAVRHLYSNSWTPWSEAWTNNNDGSGSGLDADTCDGQHLGTSASVTFNRAEASRMGVNNTSATSKYGFSLYNGYAEGTNPTYGLMFTGTAGSGTHGAVSGDWATYFTMNGTSGRGWIFRNQSSAANVASISNQGWLTATRLYPGDSTDGYFFSDTGGRTAFTGGDFYIQSGVSNYYNYATNQYYGNTSGDNLYFRGNNLTGNGWQMTGGGNLSTGGVIRRNAHNAGHLEGGHNNLGSTANKTSPIYTIGSSYNPNEGTLGNMYGIGYSHTNASFIGFAGTSGWGMYVAADGDARIFLSGQTGSGYFTGNVTAYASDRRLKKNIQTIDNALEKVSRIRGVEFDWVDDITTEYDFHPEQMHETGVIAQEIQSVIEDAVVEAPMNANYAAKSGTDHKFLTVDKSKIVPLLIEAIKELKAEVDDLKAKLEGG